MWASDDTPVIQLKRKGFGIMVSDFIDQYCWYLRLTDKKYSTISVTQGILLSSVMLILKFHCELNPIEECGVMQRLPKIVNIYGNYTLVRLREIIHPSLESVSAGFICMQVI